MLHLSQNVYKLCFSNIYKHNLPDGAGEGRTRHRLCPAKCPNGIKLLVNQIRKIQARLRGTTHKAQQWKLPQQRAKCLTRKRLTRNSNPWVFSNVYLMMRFKSLNYFIKLSPARFWQILLNLATSQLTKITVFERCPIISPSKTLTSKRFIKYIMQSWNSTVLTGKMKKTCFSTITNPASSDSDFLMWMLFYQTVSKLRPVSYINHLNTCKW